MRRKRVFTLFFILISFSFVGTAQDYQKKLLLGSEIGGTLLDAKDPNVSGKSYNLLNIRLGPHVGWFISKRFVLGIGGEYEFVKSNFTSRPPLYGLGVYLRYYLPIKIKNKRLAERLSFLTEISYNRTNYYSRKRQVTSFNHLNEHLIRTNLGINFKVWEGFHFEYSLRPSWFLNRNFLFTYRLGLEYHFQKKAKHE